MDRLLAPLLTMVIRSTGSDYDADVVAVILKIWLQHRRLKRHRRYRRRSLYCIPIFNGRVSAILRLEPEPFKANCRLSPATFRHLMARLNQNLRERSHGYTYEFAVIVVLYWLAAGMSYRTVGNTFDICRSTVFDIGNIVLDAVISITRDIIRFPTEDVLPDIGANFGRMADSPVFNLCIGALDGSQIRFVCDDADRHDEYINRKLFYSINMQGLVDHKSRFIDLCVGFPGSCHDLRVLRHSGLYREGEYPPRGYFIIADGGYTCMRDPITMIVPYRNVNLTEDQKNFNFHLSKARSIVERAFGMMQARWRILFHRAVEVKFAKAVKVITVCAVLHSICMDTDDFINYRHPIRRRQGAPRGERGAEEFRNLLCVAHNIGRRQAIIEREGE